MVGFVDLYIQKVHFYRDIDSNGRFGGITNPNGRFCGIQDPNGSFFLQEDGF